MKKILQKIVEFIKKIFVKSQSGGGSSAPQSIKMEYAYGGVNFTKAVEDKNAVIKNLTVTNDGMKYAWSSGNLRGWGLSDTDAGALAVFAVKGSDGKYRGGKFEWISKSRTTRSFGNIKDGYGGWPKNAIETAKGYGFCIVSKDAKKRTNWIFCDKKSTDIEISARRTPIDKMD